jgi:SAM-dependent methyltransferase
MRRALLKLLACPNCGGAIELVENHEENAVRVLRGTLLCTSCVRRYPVEKGVPRLVKATEDVSEVCRRFSVQWLWRSQGRFESAERCYGVDVESCVGWVNEQLQALRKAALGNWILDAGCGAGQKTEILARLCPEQNVVGLDLGVESLEEATRCFGAKPNLDYVRGNILTPPFKAHQFDYGISLGVLHHTPNTRQAFAAFRRLLKEETACAIWIYPTYKEGPGFRALYFGRDFLLFRQGHRIPPGLLRLIAYAMVLSCYPIGDRAFQKGYRRIKKDLPFFNIEMTWQQRFSAQVFLAFDNLLPRYQFRHSITEVEGWFVGEGLVPSFHAHGFYCAATPPRNT